MTAVLRRQLNFKSAVIRSQIFFLFLVFSVTKRTCTPPFCQVVVRTLNHETCNVCLEKAVEMLIHRKCYRYCFLYGV